MRRPSERRARGEEQLVLRLGLAFQGELVSLDRLRDSTPRKSIDNALFSRRCGRDTASPAAQSALELRIRCPLFEMVRMCSKDRRGCADCSTVRAPFRLGSATWTVA